MYNKDDRDSLLDMNRAFMKVLEMPKQQIKILEMEVKNGK